MSATDFGASDEGTKAAQEWWRTGGNEYLAGKPVGGGVWACVERMIYTWQVILCDPDSIFDRWDYMAPGDALAAWALWDGTGDPPGPWHRNWNTGRRRPDGDPAQEYIHY